MSTNVSHFLSSIRQKLVYLGYGVGLIAMPSIDVLAEHNLRTNPVSYRSNHSMPDIHIDMKISQSGRPPGSL